MKLNEKDIANALEEDDLEIDNSKYKKSHDLESTMIPNKITKFRNGVEEKRANRKIYGK